MRGVVRSLFGTRPPSRVRESALGRNLDPALAEFPHRSDAPDRQRTPIAGLPASLWKPVRTAATWRARCSCCFRPLWARYERRKMTKLILQQTALWRRHRGERSTEKSKVPCRKGCAESLSSLDFYEHLKRRVADLLLFRAAVSETCLQQVEYSSRGSLRMAPSRARGHSSLESRRAVLQGVWFVRSSDELEKLMQ